MGFSINTNMGAIRLGSWINTNYSGLQSAMEKLSSGLRINRASDDPAGLVISEQLRSQIASLNQEIENTSALIHKYETASSTVAGLREDLTEIRTLALGAANEGGNSEESQAAYATTANHMVDSYNRILNRATYNGSYLLDGSEGSVAEVEALSGIDLSSPEAAEASIEVIDNAIAELDEVQMDLGATVANELESQRSSLEITAQNLTAAESQIRDADYAQEFANMIREEFRLQATLAMMAHVGVNANSVLSLMST